MQGRLSPPVKNAVQEFPSNWKQEFISFKSTGLCHIDWIVTKKSFKSNPIFKYDVCLLPIRSICADNLIDSKFYEPSFLKKNLDPICKAAVRNKIYSITIPLLEESSIVDGVIRKKFINAIKPYAKKYKDLIFSFEFECKPKEILEVVKSEKNFRITYDTGNITHYLQIALPHHECIGQLYKYIDCVHLKDRKVDGQSMEPGKGETNFEATFYLLKHFECDVDFTMQTARGKTGNELLTAVKHSYFFQELFNRTEYNILEI
jgi:hypothetical protein